MASAMQREARALLADAQAAGDAVITEAQVDGLPEPVRRYLHYAQVAGKAPIRTVHLKQRGAMPLGKRSTWCRLGAEQYITTNPPAFLWSGTLHPVPLLTISAADRFADGHGSMRIQALSRIPLGTSRGPEMDQGELLRYLGELAWYPTAVLSDSIHWQAMDAGCAQATITLGSVAASGIFHFDAQGRYTHFTANRYRAERQQQVLTPWIGRWADYRDVAGFRIPLRAEAAWLLEGGESRYFRAEVTAIAYNQTAR